MSKLTWNPAFIKVLLTFCFSLALVYPSFGQTSPPEGTEYLKPGFYAVVGAFKYPKNANKRLVQMGRMGEQSNSGFYPPRGLVYVEIGKFDTFQQALEKARNARRKHNLDSTWAFEALPYALAEKKETKIAEVVLVAAAVTAATTETVEPEPEPIPDAGIGVVFDARKDTAYVKRVMVGSPAMAIGLLPGDRVLTVNGASTTGANKEKILPGLIGAEDSVVHLTVLRGNDVLEFQVDRKVMMEGDLTDWSNPGKFSGTKGQLVEWKIAGKVVYFNTIQSGSYIEVAGQIEIINSDNSFSVPHTSTFKKAHEVIGIPLEANSSGDISLVSEILGYKKIQHDFNLLNPINANTQSFLSFEDSILVVNFELEPYTAGDIATIYNIYFFRDAAVMKPESKYEIEQLLNMLKGNLDYRIKLMGHTNGNHKGPIVEMGEGSTDYFSIEKETVENWGTAKELSQKRADLIRNYLISEGIDASRMETVGYGGKKSLYKKYDELAYKNVRVEIEILQY